MRRGTWILAVSGALTLQLMELPAVDAQTSSANAASTRSARPAADASPSTKNYYEALFGESGGSVRLTSKGSERSPGSSSTPSVDRTAAAAPKPENTPISDEELFRATAPRSVKMRPASAPPVRNLPTSIAPKDAPAAPVKQVSEETTDDPTDQKVIQATFDKPAGDTERNYIQPVRADATATKKASTAAASTATGMAIEAAGQPAVTLEWAKRSDLSVGKECHLELVVRNSGQAAAAQVAVEATFPATVRLTAVDPKPLTASDKLAWNLDTMPAGSEKRIAISLIPSVRGDLGANASVRFTGQAAFVFKVEEPLLKIDLKGPREVHLGDPASQIVTISNPGTGSAHDVKLIAQMSEGLEHRDGRKTEITIGTLAPGESQQVRLGLGAIKGGGQSVNLTATSTSEAGCTAEVKINVIAPSLQAELQGPALRYKGRNARYTLKVTNDGTVPNNNVRVTYTVPDGFEFISADRGGKHNPSQKTVQWFLGRMEAGQTVQLSCELTAAALGDFKHQMAVHCDSGVKSKAELLTRVEGVASLDAQIVDLEDPVELGVETAWEVRVRNTGSKAATNVVVTCDLPQGVELIAARGPTGSTSSPKGLSFKSLPQLAPGQQAIYRIQVRGIAEGSHRLKAHVSSDALDQPTNMEEVTRFYSDGKK